MKTITERQKDLILRALGFYRKHLIETGLVEVNEVIKRIDLLYLQLSEEDKK